MLPVIRKRVCLAKNMLREIATIAYMTHTIFTRSETIVTASKKLVPVVPTLVCKVMPIVFLIVRWKFAHPQMVVFGAPARSRQVA
jgi:hypothetical protein